MKKKTISTTAILGAALISATSVAAPATAVEDTAIQGAAAAVDPSIVTDVSFTGNLDYRSGSENHQVTINLGGINQPDGTNTIKNGEKITIDMPAGTAIQLTGSITVKDSNGVDRATVTRVDANTLELTPTNFDGAYNINLSVTVPLTYHQSTDTTEPGKTSTSQGYITFNGTQINAAENLNFTKPLPKIESNAFIYGQGFDATTGAYNGMGTRTFQPLPTDGTVELTWNTPEGVRVDTSKNFNFRTNNPDAGVLDWRWGATNNPGVTVEVVSLTESGYTVKLHGLKKGDQGYVDIPLIFDEIKAEYPGVTGTTVLPNGSTQEHNTTFRPTGFDADSNAQNAKIDVTTYVNDANPQNPTGKTADGQDSDANLPESRVNTLLGAPATVSVVVANTGTVAWGNANILNADGEIVDTVTVAPGEKVVWTTNIPVLKDIQELKYTAQALNGTISDEDPAFIQGWEIPVDGGETKTFINGQDANAPVTLPAGEVEFTGTFTNTSNFTIGAANGLTVKFNGQPVELPEGFEIAPGETVNLPAQKGSLERRGAIEGTFEVSFSQPYELPEALGGNGDVSHTSSDPAKATAELVSGISLTAFVDGQDADTPEEAVEVIVKDAETQSVKLPVTLTIPNTGDTDIINPVVTDGNGFEKVLEGVTIKVGETAEAELGDFDFPVGEVTTINFTVTDPESGTSAENPINVNVVAEVVPNDPPTVDIPEGEIPAEPETPEEEEVTPKKDLEEKPQDSKSKDTNTAANPFERAAGGSGFLAALAALGASSLAWLGISRRKGDQMSER